MRGSCPLASWISENRTNPQASARRLQGSKRRINQKRIKLDNPSIDKNKKIYIKETNKKISNDDIVQIAEKGCHYAMKKENLLKFVQLSKLLENSQETQDENSDDEDWDEYIQWKNEELNLSKSILSSLD
ncbi:uncharacterized protein LOC123684635 isoform X2 [Harmonia axyridis]|uniref:uncharacterized protein LOC123684635 isoform X2 n=1 Tax=Harmonia axyridis TaxID=115357 RepID=UPI001E2754BF|nr:uncharacterized protein LOC123684635 isoform X2 [Harmonia axyridis]